MFNNIVFVKTDPLLPSLEQEVRKNIHVVDAVMDDVIPFIKDFEESGVEVVISRGYTAKLIQDMSELQVINVEITSFDVLQSMYRNRKKIGRNEKEVGLVSYYTVSHDIKMMEDIMGLKIKHFIYKKPDDVYKILNSIKDSSIKTMFGGPTTYKYAPELNIQAIRLYPNRETVLQAIQRSKEIAKIRKQDKEHNERLNAILNLTSEGIIDINNAGNINLINPSAKRILGIKTNIKGKPAADILPEGLIDLLQTEMISKEKLVSTNIGRIVVNSSPLSSGKTRYGSLATFHDVADVQILEEKIRTETFAKGLVAKYNFGDIIGHSEPILRAISVARHYSKSEATILIIGESGTGKELFAQSIHQNSNRRNGPFVAINCAALSESLLESELFGYEDGAFTGARKGGKPGLFELANNGTLFLDEIAEIPNHLQSHLLRVIQNKEVMRVGGSRIIPVNVRIISATNKNLKALVDQELFRKDLFYRLNILRLNIPPLRERLQDIPYLAEYFISQKSAYYNTTVPPLSDTIIEYLHSYDWPGNIRQLEAYIEKFVVLYDAEWVSENKNATHSLAIDLLKQEIEEILEPFQPTLNIPIGTLEDMENNILKQLEQITPDKHILAKRLGISRTTLWRKLQNTKI